MLQMFYESQDFFLVYFWSLPSCAGNQLRNVYLKLESDLQTSNNRLEELTQQSNALKKGREESDEREEALAELKAIELKHKVLKKMQLKMRMLQPTDGQVGMTDDFDYLELSPAPLSSVVN
ncbi:Meiotic nuclear division protein 1-like protein, partial [Cucurbita argyrosperma subsp. argyrosperma]